MSDHSERDIERLVERKVNERLAAMDGAPEPRVSRRQALGLIGAGAIGGGLAGAGAAEGLSGGNGFDALEATSISAERVEVEEALTVGGRGVSPGGGAAGTANPDVIYADSAAEIQPAIDALAEDIDDGGARGGVVQLGAKTYYPETTIWLKGGVTLQGIRRTRSTNPHRTNEAEQHTHSTVLSTAEMATGADAFTYEHDPSHPHPHFPVVANYLAPPVVDGSERQREPTGEERRHWGHDIGLRNLIIQADDTRWWDWDEHGPGSVYDSEAVATYFGVYDATVFEQATNLLTENVETRGFLGYGGFFKDTRNAVDRGSKWSGGATDYHGAAFEADQDGTYTSGVWDFQARGPMPTVMLGGHIDNEFVSSGFTPRNTVIGTGHTFLGDEDAYWNGDAPLTDPDYGDSIVVERDQRTTMDGYHIARSGNDRHGVGLHIDNAVCTFRNVSVSGTETAFNGSGAGAKTRLIDCKAGRSDLGMYCGNAQPAVDGFYLEACGVGFSFSGRARPVGTFDGVTFFRNCETVFGEPNGRPVTFNYPCFYGATDIGTEFDELTINDPTGYDEIA